MTITVPAAGVSSFTIPPLPAAASAGLRIAADRYLAEFQGDGTEASGNRWSEAAKTIADYDPASLTDVAFKLLFVAHYMSPAHENGEAVIDLSSFDVDAGHMLLRCVSDIGRFAGTSGGPTATWTGRLAEYERRAALLKAASAFGGLAVANRKVAEVGGRPALIPDSAENAADNARWEAVWKEMGAAEEAHHVEFIAPWDAAAIALVTTPAPNLAAAARKIDVIIEHELDNHSDMTGDPWAIIQEDMARLAAPPVLPETAAGEPSAEGAQS